jgi:hypothetical protein
MSEVLVFENHDHGFVSVYKADTKEEIRAAYFDIIKNLGDYMVYPYKEEHVSDKNAELALLDPEPLPEPFRTEVLKAQRAVQAVATRNADDKRRYDEYLRLKSMTVEEASKAMVTEGKYERPLVMNVWDSYFDHDSDYRIGIETLNVVL